MNAQDQDLRLELISFVWSWGVVDRPVWETRRRVGMLVAAVVGDGRGNPNSLAHVAAELFNAGERA